MARSSSTVDPDTAIPPITTNRAEPAPVHQGRPACPPVVPRPASSPSWRCCSSRSPPYRRPPPATAAQADAATCKRGGWQAHAPAENPTVAFASQGDCVSYGSDGGQLVDLLAAPETAKTEAPGTSENAPGGDNGEPASDGAEACREGTWVDLANAHLAGIDLGGANLSESDLTGPTLAGANLAGADLSGRMLAGADLTGAVVDGANLCRATCPANTAAFTACNDATSTLIGS